MRRVIPIILPISNSEMIQQNNAQNFAKYL